MSKYETITLIVTMLAWLASLIIQWVILSRQNTFQKNLTELQNNLSARRELAPPMLDDLLLMKTWLEEGLEIQENVLLIESFLTIDEAPEPELDLSKITTQINTWPNSSKKLMYLAQIYNPKFDKSAGEWNYKLDGESPEDLPRLIESFQRTLYSFFWKQFTIYTNSIDSVPTPSSPEEQEFLASLIPDAGKYIIPLYK